MMTENITNVLTKMCSPLGEAELDISTSCWRRKLAVMVFPASSGAPFFPSNLSELWAVFFFFFPFSK